MPTERHPETARTPAEEQLVTWDYYLDMAINLFASQPAHDLLMAYDYDVGRHLRDLKDALSWPSPSGAATALAERALGAAATSESTLP